MITAEPFEGHLQPLPGAAPRTTGEPFRSIQAYLVLVPTGHHGRVPREFRDALAATALGRPDLADLLVRIGPYAGSLERLRDRHLSVLSRALAEERD